MPHPYRCAECNELLGGTLAEQISAQLGEPICVDCLEKE